MKLQHYTILLALMTMTGCTSMNSDFDCPMKQGVRCQSLDQVNDAIDKGEIGQSRRFTEYEPTYIKSYWSRISSRRDSIGLPMRTPEDVLRVWIAPYEDTNGNFHQASDVYTVSRPSVWVGNPPKEMKGV